MKTAADIRKDFDVFHVYTAGAKNGNCYMCEVFFPDGKSIKGFGSTPEKAEDTAWHGVKITLKTSDS